MPTRRWFSLAVCLTALLGGCAERAPETRRAVSEGRSAQRRAAQANVLLATVADRLRSLPEVPLALRPPVVVLDARTSADGEDIEAVLKRPPGSPAGALANLLEIATGNGRFRSVGVAPGDNVKYYVIPDRDTLDRLRASGEADIVTFTAANLAVAQVLDDNRLLVVGGLPQEIVAPAKVEVWRNVDDRMDAIESRLGRYTERRDPPLAWQPAPDEAALSQMVERLNQWSRQRGEASPERPASATGPLADRVAALATLPQKLLDDDRVALYVSEQTLGRAAFDAADGRRIAEAVWVRDIGAWARGAATDPASQAAALLDWVARNVQLVDDAEEPPHFVWELLLHGRGTAAQRAWVFAELCRQQRLPAAVLLTPSSDGPDRTLVAVADGDAWRVFDPELGLPLPGPEGDTAATLADLRADDALLRRLDADDQAYPHTADDFGNAGVAIVADAFALSDRAATLSGVLSGADRLALAADLPAESARLAPIAPDGEVALWDHPYRALGAKLSSGPATRRREVKRFLPFAWRPRLWKARALHFRGRLVEADTSRDALAADVNDHQAAQQLYMSPRVRPTDRRLDAVASEVKREIYRAAKAAATLWAGIVAYERGDFVNARSWFERAADAEGFDDRRSAATYNLARALEAAGDAAAAADLLEDAASPERLGDRLLARRLRSQAEGD